MVAQTLQGFVIFMWVGIVGIAVFFGVFLWLRNRGKMRGE